MTNHQSPMTNDQSPIIMKNRRVVIVTGAYGEIGKAIAESIAKNHLCEVVLVGRNEKN